MEHRDRVRTHTRTTPSGRTTTVRQHTREGKPKQKIGPNTAHARKLMKRARTHHRRGRKGRALMLGFLAAGEVTAWFTLSGTSLVLVLTAGALAGLSVLLVK